MENVTTTTPACNWSTPDAGHDLGFVIGGTAGGAAECRVTFRRGGTGDGPPNNELSETVLREFRESVESQLTDNAEVGRLLRAQGQAHHVNNQKLALNSRLAALATDRKEITESCPSDYLERARAIDDEVAKLKADLNRLNDIAPPVADAEKKADPAICDAAKVAWKGQIERLKARRAALVGGLSAKIGSDLDEILRIDHARNTLGEFNTAIKRARSHITNGI